MISRLVLLLCLATVTTATAAVAADAPSWWSILPTADSMRAMMLSSVRGQLGPGAKLGDLTVVQAYPPVLDLKDLELPLGTAAGSPHLIVPAGHLVVTPSNGKEPAHAVLTAPTASLTAPKAFTVKHLTARVAQAATGLVIQHFDCGIYGGTASGSLAAPAGPGAAPRLTLELAGIELAAVTGRSGHEHLSATITGPLPARIEDFSAKGRATVSGLATDLRNDPTLRGLDAKAQQGQRTSAMVGDLSGLVGNDSLRGLVGSLSGGNQAAYYHEVLSGLRRHHDLGSASGPLTISKGVATINPFAGSRVGGKLSMNLTTLGLSGYLSRVNLGRVTLQSVSISGTAANPGYSVNQNRVLVDGHRPSSSSGPSIPKQLPRALIGEVLRRQGGGGGGNLLQGLLGSF